MFHTTAGERDRGLAERAVAQAPAERALDRLAPQQARGAAKPVQRAPRRREHHRARARADHHGLDPGLLERAANADERCRRATAPGRHDRDPPARQLGYRERRRAREHRPRRWHRASAPGAERAREREIFAKIGSDIARDAVAAEHRPQVVGLEQIEEARHVLASCIALAGACGKCANRVPWRPAPCKAFAQRASPALEHGVKRAVDRVMRDKPGQRLSALEAAFLGLESRAVPFVHASILSFDRAIPLDALRSHVDAALAGIRRYHQRIARRPLGSADWVDDTEYQIEHHVHAISAAAPGGTRELDELAAQLLASELPTDHSPWRLWTVSGLAGDRGAVIAVFHHALVDGIAGFRLLEHVLGAAAPAGSPAGPDRPPLAATGRLAAVRRLVTWTGVGALAKLLRDGLRPGAQLGINPRRTGRTRAVADHTVDLEEVKLISHAFDATVNDVVLATVAGALRRFVSRRGFAANLHDVRAMVPVGRHAKDAHDSSGNRVVLMLVPLPVDEVDPARCLLRVSAEMRALKRGHSIGGGELMLALSEATTPALLTGVLRAALRLRGFNLIVTNVPGPPASLWLLGARLTRIVPIVNLWPNQALGIAVASYAGALTFGIQTDRAVIPDPDQFRDDLAVAFHALGDASREKRAAAVPPADAVAPPSWRAGPEIN
jgi:WS/DGAT/MGAT family acyltransferase